MEAVSATEFNRNPSQVKRMAEVAPVVITEHNRPKLVLLAYEQYERLVSVPVNLADWLEMDEDFEIEFEPVGLGIEPVDDL